MKTTLYIQRSTLTKSRLAEGHHGNAQRKDERGIALVITLGVLTVILLIAVAFALSARTEAKSGSSYDILVQAKSFAKMGMDRCLMEHAYNVSSTPYSGRTGPYTVDDLTQIDGSHTNDTAPEFGVGNEGDFVDVDNDGVRGLSEPYWIAITNNQGKLIGRIAYGTVKDESGTGGAGAGSGSTLVDINAIGNIRGASDTYVRSNGYYGVTNSITAIPYSRGVAADINLEAFFEKLGYSDPTLTAQRVMQRRYGWDGSGTPTIGDYKPGANFTDDNNLNGTDDIGEYDAVQLRGDDAAISDLAQIDGLLPAADPASAELANYATITSSDLNKVNPYGVNRVDLNNMTGTVHVPTVIQALQRAGLDNYWVTVTNNNQIYSYSNTLEQMAVNLIDFHTTNTAPTVYTNSVGDIVAGVKRTPYLWYFDLEHFVMCPTNTAGEATVRFRLASYAKIYNPYPVNFTHNGAYGIAEGVFYFYSTNAVHPNYLASTNINWKYSWTAGTLNSNTFSAYVPGLGSGGYVTNDMVLAGPFPATNGLPDTLLVSNTLTVTFGYIQPAGVSNLVKVYKMNTPGGVDRTVTAGTSSYAGGGNYYIVLGVDDPRIGIMYTNKDLSGLNSPVYNPATPSPREGTNTYYLKASNYTSLGEIGQVHLGEPWRTFRLQPGGEGGLLDHVYVSPLNEVRGRINLNSETNGPPSGTAPLQSPAFWALFAGLSVTNTSTASLQTISSNKIEAIIAELGAYRSTLTNIENGVTNTVFTNIGQICELSTLVTDQNGNFIPYANDAARELIVRSIADLITTRAEAGSELLAWGQVIKGNQPAGTIQIRAWYSKPDKMIKIKKFQYIRQ